MYSAATTRTVAYMKIMAQVNNVIREFWRSSSPMTMPFARGFGLIGEAKAIEQLALLTQRFALRLPCATPPPAAGRESKRGDQSYRTDRGARGP